MRTQELFDERQCSNQDWRLFENVLFRTARKITSSLFAAPEIHVLRDVQLFG